MLREERERGFDVVTFEQLRQAQKYTQQMRERGLLRPRHGCKWVKIPDPFGAMAETSPRVESSTVEGQASRISNTAGCSDLGNVCL